MENTAFANQDLAKAYGACLNIYADYATEADKGKLNSVKRNRNNWKARAAAECADAIAALDEKARDTLGHNS